MKTWGVLAGCLMLAGCASWGGNVKGDFACKAPQGTCAPTAEIDARAVAKATRGGTGILPAAAGAARTVQGEAMARSVERVLRIVFYPHIDEQGHFHEKAAVQAVVAGSGWQDGAGIGPATGSGQAGSSDRGPDGDAAHQAASASSGQEAADEPR